MKKTFETFNDWLSIVKKILITLTGPHSKSYATCNDIYKQLKLFIESAPVSILVGIFQRQPYLCDTSTGAHSSCSEVSQKWKTIRPSIFEDTDTS